MSTSFVKQFEDQAVNVYVVDPDRLDLTSSRFSGLMKRLYPDEDVAVHVLIENKVNLQHIAQQASEIKRRLLDFDPRQDKLVVIGRSMSNFVVGMQLALLMPPDWDRKLTLLLFNYETSDYNEFTLELGRR